MDKQNFYQEKYEYYRTLNLWAVFGISIPSIGYFFSDCYLLGGFSTETLISRSAIIIPFLIYLILNKYTKDYRIMVPMSYAIGHGVMWCTIWACTSEFCVCRIFYHPVYFSGIWHCCTASI
jgi:hypothetical protein